MPGFATLLISFAFSAYPLPEEARNVYLHFFGSLLRVLFEFSQKLQ